MIFNVSCVPARRESERLSMSIVIANLIVAMLCGYLDPRTRDVRT